MDLVSQQHWDNSYSDYTYHVAQDEVTQWIDQSISLVGSQGNLFEFGCYPGRYLSHLGKKGWRVGGADLTPGIEKGFKEWLTSEQIEIGNILRTDALAYAKNSADRYDLVCSFGFIEHFENFLDVISLHDKILKPNGWLMITTPNFKGAVQQLLHSTLNIEGLKIHYLPSMKPRIWTDHLSKMGYKIYYSGYFGGFDFWYDEQKRNLMQRTAIKAIQKIKPFFKNVPNNSTYSPYCGIIARKNAS